MLCPEHPLDKSKIENATHGEGGHCNLECHLSNTHIQRSLIQTKHTQGKWKMTDIAKTEGKRYKRGVNTNKGKVCV